MNDVDKVVAAILSYTKRLQDEVLTISGEELSRIAITLSAMKAFLGEHVAQLRADRDGLAARLDHYRATQYRYHRSNGQSIKDAEASVKIDSESRQEELNTVSHRYEQIRILHQDTHDVLESVKSRLIHFMQERGESRNAEV